ncbi:permease of the drug/metabolite transporter (dmt) superfamily [hydrocarbon metagenome]|uniref:Permease of the drug/metabolite transporter (Dmt) superfamily n=1 Tax=hydrocarbon metagenome TaxID=938273 RepID=A0A0W8E483_9ZZZZ
MNKFPDSIIGAIFICISAFAYATQTILGKFAFSAGLTPESLLLLRYILTASFITPYLFFKKSAVIDKSPLVLLQAFLFASEGLLFFYALQHLSASITVVVFFSHPVLVAISSSIIFKEKLHSYFILGLILAITGVILVSGLLGGAVKLSVLGLALIVGAAVLYTIYSLISQKNVRTVSPLIITNTLAVGSIVILLALYHDLSFLAQLSMEQLLITLVMTVLNTLIAVVFFLKGVKKIGASRATLLGTLEPVLAMLLAFSLLGESLSRVQMLGAIMVFISIFLAVYPASSGHPSSSSSSNT